MLVDMKVNLQPPFALAIETLTGEPAVYRYGGSPGGWPVGVTGPAGQQACSRFTSLVAGLDDGRHAVLLLESFGADGARAIIDLYRSFDAEGATFLESLMAQRINREWELPARGQRARVAIYVPAELGDIVRRLSFALDESQQDLASRAVLEFSQRYVAEHGPLPTRRPAPPKRVPVPRPPKPAGEFLPTAVVIARQEAERVFQRHASKKD